MPVAVSGFGHKFEVEELSSRSWPVVAAMAKEPLPVTGNLSLADQMTVVVVGSDKLWYQTEKVKRFRELGFGRNPAAKVELGERRILFWFGRHGESEEEKDDMY